MALLNLLLTLTLLLVAIETKEELNLDDVTAIVGEKFDYQIGDEAFLSTYKIYRIVQRGQRKLPSWLTFDTNSSMLIGYPKTEDVGMHTLRLRAQCIDPTVSDCQDKLSRTFHVTVMEPLKSAESRGRHTVIKHEKKEKWIDTNMHNGNTRLYVEYDISRHGTVVEKTSGMLVSGSEHVLSTSALYSAMQYNNVANFFLNTNMHDKLSSQSYPTMQYLKSITSFSDIHEQLPAEFHPPVRYVNLINSDSILNSDLPIHSSEMYSSMQYNSYIYSFQKSDLHETFASHIDEALHNKHSFLPGINSQISQEFKPTYSYLEDSSMQKEVGIASDITILDSSLEKTRVKLESYHSRKNNDVSMPDLCQTDQTVFNASLILHVINALSVTQESLIIQKWSNFISKEPSLISITRTEADIMDLRYSGKYILTAGPGNVIESLSESVELTWHLACGYFEQLHDFTSILLHNIEVGRVSEEIGFDVIAWFVYTDRPLPKRIKRQAHSGRRQTATPTFSPPVPTTLSEIFTSVPESSSESSHFSLMSSDITAPFSISTSSFSLPVSALSQTSELFSTSLLPTVVSFSPVNTITTDLFPFTETSSLGLPSLSTKSVISSLFTIFASSQVFSRISSATATVISSLKTSLFLPSVSMSSYLYSTSSLAVQSTLFYVNSSGTRSSAVGILSTPSLSSYFSDSTWFSPNLTISTMVSLYTPAISTSFTLQNSSFSYVPSSQSDLTYPSVTSFSHTSPSSSMMISMSELNSKSLTETITYTSMSKTSSTNVLQSDSSFLSSATFSSSIEAFSTKSFQSSSKPVIDSTENQRSSVLLTSFSMPPSVSSLTSTSDTIILRSSYLSSEFDYIDSTSLTSSLMSTPDSLKVSSTILFSSFSVGRSTILSKISLSSSHIKSMTTELILSSNNAYSSVRLPSSASSVLFPSESISDILKYSTSVATISFFLTSVVSPFVSKSFSLTNYSGSFADLHSTTVSSTLFSEETKTPLISSVFLTNSVVSTPIISSIRTSVRVSTEIISPSTSIKIFSSFPSSLYTRRSTVFELTPTLSVPSTSDIIFSSDSTVLSKSSVIITVSSSSSTSKEFPSVSTLVTTSSISPTRVSTIYSSTSMESTIVVSTGKHINCVLLL